MKPLNDLMDIAALNRDIADGYIAVRVHPNANDLLILNYTQKAQFAGHWTDATRKSRGLIVRDGCRHNNSEKSSFDQAISAQTTPLCYLMPRIN